MKLFATTCLAPQRLLDEALVEVKRAAALDPLSPLPRSMIGAVLWYRREFDAALGELEQALKFDPSYTQASEDALTWLEKAVDSKIPQMIWLDFQAPFQPLHGSVRYRALRRRMHLD